MAKKKEKPNMTNIRNLDTSKKANHLDIIVNNAVDEGIRALVKENPKFASFENYLAKHIDEKALSDKIEYLKLKVAQEPGLTNYQKTEKLSHKISNYVASGGMLDDVGKEKILLGRLEDKARNGFFRRLFGPKTDGEKYLQKTFETFDDLSALISSGDYYKRMPELAKSLSTLENLKFLNPAIEVLKDGGLISKKEYQKLKGQVQDRLKEGVYVVPKTIESYLVPQKAAAGILTFFGMGLILATSTGITGNVIRLGDLFSNTGSLIGAGCLLLGIVLFLFSRKSK